ncbi:NAD(P)-binding domain-containing protein [uncultured Alsobacter sp.]|uniref:NAD(P)-dependent oxidoreductase n=1 Tax=uncultured Alsobacter sp. TaxID=1748258 RepID=UPI0025DB3318|nr:NAD(P)-binding domain-containing protein [uncultured Alsobacter sp.]
MGNALRIAFIGFGEVGQLFTRQLAARPDVTLTAWDIQFAGSGGAAMKARAADGVTPANDVGEACRGAAVVISAVTADSAVDAARQAAPHLKPGQLYVDLNSVSPTTKTRIAEALAPSGCDFVEFAVMAPVAQPGIAVPILAGGGRAGEIAGLLNPLGMAITAVSEEIGVASATKLCRSIVIKGMEALMVDLGLVGEKTGVLPAVLASLTASYPGMDWAQVLKVMPGRVRQHGVRRAAEMREVARMLEENGFDGGLAEAIARRHETFADPKPKDLTKPADLPKTDAPAAAASTSSRSTADVA